MAINGKCQEDGGRKCLGVGGGATREEETRPATGEEEASPQCRFTGNGEKWVSGGR